MTAGLECIHIEEAALHPELWRTVAGWLHAEWFRHDGLSPEELVPRLALHGGGEAPPKTFFAMREDSASGTFTLFERVDPESGLPGLFLGNVFVEPGSRRRGLGSWLCEAAVAQAARMRIPRLCLFAAEHVNFYARLGWQPRAELYCVCGEEVRVQTLMKRDVEITLSRPPA